MKYVLLSLLIHFALLTPILFFAPKEEENLNVGSVFVEVKEIKSLSTTGLNEPLDKGEVSEAPPSNSSSPVSAPEGLNRIDIRPEYPEISRKLGEEGACTFVLTLDKDGSVMMARLEKSSGHSRLDEAARDALLKASFKGETETEKHFTVVFRLNEKPLKNNL